jgi:hypothetical protein
MSTDLAVFLLGVVVSSLCGAGLVAWYTAFANAARPAAQPARRPAVVPTRQARRLADGTYGPR